MQVELELKYGATTPEVLDEILQNPEMQNKIIQKTQVITMKTQYFDNSDGDFSARRWTLRLRSENNQQVITLKTKGATVGTMEGRIEWEFLGDSMAEAVQLFVEQGAPQEILPMFAKGLLGTCAAAFVRRATLLDLGNSTHAELALDVGTLSGGQNSLNFQEVEVELKQGNPEIMEQFGLFLSKKFALYPEVKSKLARALSLRTI